MRQSMRPRATKAKKPVSEIQYGVIKATIWEHHHDPSSFFTVDIYRIYKDANNKWKKTYNFNLSDLPKVEKVAADAYREIYVYRSQSDPVESLSDAA